MLYIYGHMGNGKSNFALRCGEDWKRDNPDGEIGTNIRTLTEKDHWIRNWGQLQDWMVESESKVLAGDVTPKLFIFDEASGSASGRGSDGWEAATKLAVLAYKIRKYGGSAIIIGHDGQDVAPAVREMCTAVHKTGKKTARFYESVKNRQGRDPLTPPLTGIEPTIWSYNDKEASDWSWKRGFSEDSESITAESAYRDMAVWTAIKAKEKGLANREVADIVGFSRESVRTWWNDYQEGGKAAETVASVQEVIA